MTPDRAGADPEPRGPSDAAPASSAVLAAVARGVRHAARPGGGASTAAVLVHLGLAPRSAAAAGTRAALERLAATRMLAHTRAHGRDLWLLAPRGAARLETLRAAGLAPELCESPQHRAWREARAVAAAAYDGLAADLAAQLERLHALVAQAPAGASDELFVLGAQTHAAARALASASYCLFEWAEPDDARADVDDLAAPARGGVGAAARDLSRTELASVRAGRRNVRLWSDAPR